MSRLVANTSHPVNNHYNSNPDTFRTNHVNRAWENVKENIKTSAKERLGLHKLKHHKPWFDKECLGFLDQRKQATMQWVQDPSQSNIDNLNSKT